jgi:hypothetical protein
MARKGTPIEVKDYDFANGWENYSKWLNEEIAKLQKNKDPDAKDLTGSLVKYPQGDGYAYYVVTKHSPLTLSLVLIGDAWELPDAHLRGLRESDIRQQLRSKQMLQQLFAKKG